MKTRFFYIIVILCSTVLPIAILRNSITGFAATGVLLAIYGAGRAFQVSLFPSDKFAFNSFGIGFILLAAVSLATALLELNAVFFTVPFLLAACYGLYFLVVYLKTDIEEHPINWALIAIYLLILCLNIYPTLLLQGYSHDGVVSWVNTDAMAYTSIANRVRLGIYPITIPGFAIDKLYYHYGAYAYGGFVAKLFNITAGDALFGIIRPLAVFSVITSLVSIGLATFRKQTYMYRVAGVLIGFFLIGSLTSIFEYLPVHFSRMDHGMKHLRGFLIGHSSLWIFTALTPVMALLNDIIVRKKKFNAINISICLILVASCAALNFVAASMCFFLLMFFLLFYRESQLNNSFVLKRNIAIIASPVVFLLIGISYYLHNAEKNIETSAFFLPVFDLGTWSNFLMIFFILYTGIRLSGLNYFYSKTEKHLGYIQFIILMAAISYMILIGFFVEPKGGRGNDIKYGYVMIEGVLGIFSGLWLAEKIGTNWFTRQKYFLIRTKNIAFPLIIVSSLLLLIALSGLLNSRITPSFVSPYIKSIIIPALSLLVLAVTLKLKNEIPVNKKLLFSLIVFLCLISLPGSVYEFNKYRTINDNDEAVQVNAGELKLINELNAINDKHELVFVLNEDPHAEGSGKSYSFSSLSNAPVLNEASYYFGVKNRKNYPLMEKKLDSLLADKSVSKIKNIADDYHVSYFIFKNSIVKPSLFDSSAEFKIKTSKDDSVYIVEYKQKK